EEERLAREKDEANVILIEEWDDIQAKIDVDYQLAQRLQAQEQEELTVEEKSTLFKKLLDKRRKHFAAKRAEEQRNKPPTRAQKKTIMCNYLKNMEGKKVKDLKNKYFDFIQKLFDKAMKRVNTFVDMDTELMEGSETRVEGSETRAEIAQESSSKRGGDELEQEVTNKQKIDDDQEAIDAIPLGTDGSSKRYSAFIQMLKSFDREDLETLWKLVKAKHGSTRPEEGYERVLWGDLKIIVHFVRFQSMHIVSLTFSEAGVLHVNWTSFGHCVSRRGLL
ncbi:hypothetical protein Tco_1300311, partial [Tanacetum coccineum]